MDLKRAIKVEGKVRQKERKTRERERSKATWVAWVVEKLGERNQRLAEPRKLGVICSRVEHNLAAKEREGIHAPTLHRPSDRLTAIDCPAARAP